MNRQIKAKWIAALRSGKYEQTQDVMRRKLDNGKSGYCCLGVLGSIRGASDSSLSRTGGKLSHPAISKLLPLKTRETLAEKNDNGWSFKRIATWIQKNVKAQS